LPQLLLELLGTYTAVATSFTIFYTSLSSFRKEIDLEYLRRQMYAIRLIVFGLVLSIYAFLVAWSVEVFLPYTISYNSIWYRTIYLFEFITIITYIGFFYDFLKRKVLPYLDLTLSLGASGSALFIASAGGPAAIESSIPSLMFLAILSLLYPLQELRKAFLSDKTFKRLHDSLKKLGCYLANARGRSMLPTIRTGDHLIVLKVNETSELQEGDIIDFDPPLYYNGFGGFVSHKIIHIDKDKIRTKGDNNKRPDPPIKYQHVRGIVIGKCTPSFTVCEPLTNRLELISIFREAEALISEEMSKIDMRRTKRRTMIRSVVSLVFVVAVAFLLPFLFLIV